MTASTRQSNLFALQDWKTLYTTFSQADFQSYDFETMRKVMVDYIRTYYAEDFNDFVESSEFIALLDLIAFTAQSTAFRTDLNARENFLETAERTDSVLKLVKQLGYQPNRNKAASGVLKVTNISTTESLTDVNGNNLANSRIYWNDTGNPNWYSQFVQIINASIGGSRVGKPYSSKSINGILTEQYNIALPTTTVPLFKFATTLDQQNVPFEVVSATLQGTDNISEQAPGLRGEFGILNQNDGQGNSSTNTGFFLMFKQGTTVAQDFNIVERIPNRTININTDNINNEDIWLYDLSNGNLGTLWNQIAGVYSNSAIYSGIGKGIRTLYSVATRANDQIDLVFGDGVFSDIPQGNYRVFYRTSNNSTYRISPSNLNSVLITIPYLNRQNRIETLSLTVSLQYTVSNASRRDLLPEIKQKAPQAFYSQGRMVNGEDYNIFPYTQYSDIVKIKAVNRYSTGTSRGQEINDPTGKYSSSNLFASDGVFYKETTRKTFNFTFNTRNDILEIFAREIQPLISGSKMKQFYYEYFPTISFPSVENGISSPTVFWKQSSNDSVSSTGFFVSSQDNVFSLGNYSTSTTKYLLTNSLIKFTAPTGYYFDSDNLLLMGTPTAPTDRTVIWAGIQSVLGDGTTANYVAGRTIGAVALSENIPEGAIVDSVYAPWSTTVQNSTLNTIANLIFNYQEFAMEYNRTLTSTFSDPWTVISIDNANLDMPFDFATTGTNDDSSWLLLFQTDGTKYTVDFRGLEFVFGSADEVKFLSANPKPIFDASVNRLETDAVTVLSYNNNIDQPVRLRVTEIILENDGYSDNSRIQVGYPESFTSGLPLDPDIFRKVITDSRVYYKVYTDRDNLIRYALMSSGSVTNSATYDTGLKIANNQNLFPVGKIFYAAADDRFYTIAENSNRQKQTVDVSNEYRVFTGRQDLAFQYRHNSAYTTRTDPAVSNVIDLYILQRSYDEQFRNYAYDITNRVSRPADPDTTSLTNSYENLYNYKMISDELILNPGVYKLLFGSKAPLALQANFQVVKSVSTTVSDNELKSRIVEEINNYFAIENWDFGDTFYFSELSGYLHNRLANMLNSIVLVPTDTSQPFGSLYEIRSQPNEIFISAATVDNIIVTAAVLSGINSAGLSTVQVI
jgi:hypothetical protein